MYIIGSGNWMLNVITKLTLKTFSYSWVISRYFIKLFCFTRELNVSMMNFNSFCSRAISSGNNLSSWHMHLHTYFNTTNSSSPWIFSVGCLVGYVTQGIAPITYQLELACLQSGYFLAKGRKAWTESSMFYRFVCMNFSAAGEFLKCKPSWLRRSLLRALLCL